MAREHARIKLSIWDDAQFRQLSPAAQHLYFVLLSHNKLDYAGVTDWRPARLAAFSGAWSVETVKYAAQELSEQRYIVIDEATEEVLIRSFIRNDEFMDQPNMAVAMRKAHRAVASPDLRGVVVHELIRLNDDKPELKGWAKVVDMLGMPSVDPSQRAPFKASVNPSGKGEPNPSVNPSGIPSPTTSPNSLSQLPAPSNTKTVGQDLGGERPETSASSDVTEPPKGSCIRHPNGNPADERCDGCRKSRELDDRRLLREADKAARVAEAARLACTRCDGVWITNDDGSPSRRKCDHRSERAS